MPTSDPITYTGQMQGYLGTGFTFDEICRMHIVENHPAVMRYTAFRAYLRLTFPERGSRPEWAKTQLSRLSGNAHAATQAQTPTQQDGYMSRQVLRDRAYNDAVLAARRAGEQWAGWEGEPPALPRVPVPRGRSAGQARERRRAIVRPATSWQEQVLSDYSILQTLGHKIPRSINPTQTWWQPHPDRAGSSVQEGVPLGIALHSWLSCNGKRPNGSPCPHCVKDGKYKSTRPRTAGWLRV